MRSLLPINLMPSKETDIKERAKPEVRVKVKANFTGYIHSFGITVEKGEEYELKLDVINKYNKQMKVKGSNDKPFKILSKEFDAHVISTQRIRGTRELTDGKGEGKGMTTSSVKGEDKKVDEKEDDKK